MAEHRTARTQAEPSYEGKGNHGSSQRPTRLSRTISQLMRFVIVLLLVLSALSQHALFAQTDLGSVTGIIRDSSDAAIPNCQIRVKQYNGDSQVAGSKRYSVEYGPTLLAAVGTSRVNLLVDQGNEAEHLANYLEAIEGTPLHFTVRGNDGQKFAPYWLISEEEFSCYSQVTVNA